MGSINIFSLFLFLLLSFSCRKIEEKAVKSEPSLNIMAYFLESDPYVGDESLNTFLKFPWYAYDEENHIIWPNFRIYSVRTKSAYYKLQIIDYYNESSMPGRYTIRLESKERGLENWNFEAQGCGNVYTNLSYKDCLKDPSTNVYTYLNLGEKRYWKMSADEALKNREWDIAFNGTEVKVNSGQEGPGDSRLASLYLYGAFFKGAEANFQLIAKESFGAKGISFFQIPFRLENAAYSLPEGVDRVINESDWFEATRSGHTSVNENWWIVRGGEGRAFTKLNFSSIDEREVNGFVESTITLGLYNQGTFDFRFGAYETWTLPTFSSEERLLKWCLDLQSKEVVDCANPAHDLLLSVSNRRNGRRWRINVTRGAIGPLNFREMEARQSGN